MLRLTPITQRLRAARLRPLSWAMIWATCACAVVIIGELGRVIHPQQPWHPDALSAPTSDVSQHGRWIPTGSSWAEQLLNPAFWTARRRGDSGWNDDQPRRFGLTRGPQQVPLGRELVSPGLKPLHKKSARRRDEDFEDVEDDEDDNSERRVTVRTYRTMCVRTCDGFYWPVSYSTTKDKFEDDASICASSCGGPDAAKLYVYRNPGSNIDAMADLQGHAYARLATAFAFRTKYEPTCKCRPHPWEQEAIDRHKMYALASLAQKGDKVAALQLKALRDEKLAIARETYALKSTSSEAAARTTRPLSKPDIYATAATREIVKTRRGLSAAEISREQAHERQLKVISPDGTGANPSGAAGDGNRVVILHFGSRPPLSVTVPSSGRFSRAADALPPTVRER